TEDGPRSGTGARRAEAVGPGAEVGQLVLRLAGEEVDEAALHALALEQGVVHLACDRHLDREPDGEGDRRVDRVGALRDAGKRGLDVRPAATRRELDAEPMVARQRRSPGGHDVAEAGQPRERHRVRAGRDAEPHHLGQAAGDEPRLAVVTEAEAVGGPGGDRYYVI